MMYKQILGKAVEWRLLSLLLERPKTGWHQEIESLAKEVRDPILHQAAALSQDASEEKYLALLGPAGAISPREAGYIGFEDPGQLLAEVMAFYQAFFFSPQAEDPPDHIAVEAGFVGYLELKEAYAQMSENAEAIQITQTAKDRFLELHFCRLVRGLAQKFPVSGPSYLTKTVEALLKRVEHLPVTSIETAVTDPLASGCPMVNEESM